MEQFALKKKHAPANSHRIIEKTIHRRRTIAKFGVIDDDDDDIFSNRERGPAFFDQTRLYRTKDIGFRINGHMTIFNQEFRNTHMHRNGSANDVKYLIDTFRRLGIEPTVKPDLNYQDIVKEIEILSQADFSTHKLFVCVFMSQGAENGIVSAADGGFNFEKTIIEPIMRNKSLIGIPKIFITVACRGPKQYEVTDIGELDGSILLSESGIDYTNLIISYSTYEGHVSKRTIVEGTYFIQYLCAKINEDKSDTKIHSLFAKVNAELAKMHAQVPVFQTTMGDAYFWHPSLHTCSETIRLAPGHMTIFNQEFKRSATNFNHNFKKNPKPRGGSVNDVDSLMSTFRRFGIEPKLKPNLQHEDIVKEVDVLSHSDFSSYGLFVCVYMSHGNEDGMVFAADTKFNLRRTIIDPILRNRSLLGVPKIFITVACRGRKKYKKCDIEECCDSEECCDLDESDIEDAEELDGHILSADSGIDYSNRIISYSTCEGHVSFRRLEGTYFIRCLCDTINEDNGDTKIHSILAEVNKKLTELNVQVPVYHSTMGDICFKDLASEPN